MLKRPNPGVKYRTRTITLVVAEIMIQGNKVSLLVVGKNGFSMAMLFRVVKYDVLRSKNKSKYF